MKHRPLFQSILVMVLLALLAAGLSQAQKPSSATSHPLAIASDVGTAFIYQGQLIYNGAPVNDTCDFTFSLWDEVGSGTPPAGGMQINSDVMLSGVIVSDGLFTVSLDFGTDAFTGDARWLEIVVECSSISGTLSPRQVLTPTPYAMYAPPNNSLVAADGDPVDAVYVDNDGNTGIGTISPGERLTVAGTVESTAGGFKFPDNTTQTTAAGGDVKQLVQDFVVSSGKSVTAGDVVSYLDGYVQHDSVVYGIENQFNPARTYYISAAALSSTRFVVAYCDDGNSNYGTAVIGEVSDSGAIITYGDEFVFNAGNTDFISAAALSSIQFVVAYSDNDNSEYGTAVIGEVSDVGATITYGDEFVFNSPATDNISVAGLSSTQFVVAYEDVSNSNHGAAVIGEVSGATVTYGLEVIFHSDWTGEISTAALSSTQFVVAYLDEDNSYYGTAVIGEISGSGSGANITYGSEAVFNSASTSFISTAALSSTQFVVAYRDSGNSSYGTAVIGAISGSGATITYGDEFVFNAGYTDYISAAALSSTQFVVAYRDSGNPSYGTAVIGAVTGSGADANITYGSEFVFNSATTTYISAATLSFTQFVVAYQDWGNSFFGTAVVIGRGRSVGIARESKTEGQTVPVIIDGVSDVHSGLTPGEIYYSDMAGGLTTSETDRRIGLAISASELLLGIDIYK